MDYTQVTETPGDRITREALSMMWTRYEYAASLCGGKRVLEVACGAGQGLGYLAARASRVVGGDYTHGLLRTARKHYGDRVSLVRLDAHSLPFRDRVFDVIILYEAIYYLSEPVAFFVDCRRVLREGGVLMICTVNREWLDFNPSPFSTTYYSATELSDLLRAQGFTVELFGAFQVSTKSPRDRLVSFLKRAAVGLHLIPRTMKGKELLKRLFFGKLVTMPAELREGLERACPLVPLDGGRPVSTYKVLYAIGRAK